MAKQTINPGTAPTGAGGDTFRSGSAKLQANDDEIYNYLGDGTNLNKLGTAAFKNTGTSTGSVMEVGAFGWGGAGSGVTAVNGANVSSLLSELGDRTQIFAPRDQSAFFHSWSPALFVRVGDGYFTMSVSKNGSGIRFMSFTDALTGNPYIYNLLTSLNTQTDPNGFIKAASPIVQLYADKIELNDEAQRQNIEFEKLGVGNYLIKGSSGFAQEGWYIETPKDANGNILVAVVYEQLENGDISVKTYDYMLNKKGRIVADTEAPLDIPESRRIDLRLQELPQPEIEIPESIAPPDFQPTGLAQAVATVMESYHDPEQ